ncbi:Hin recombinase [Streptomyces sp. NPDC046977]|uniref:Hin recombinase n=1 Tax=Streptomyces sp. NPDC046977 TaxID=3154703 RepID=UPI0033D3D6E7
MTATPEARAWHERGDQRSPSPLFRPAKLTPEQRDEIVRRLDDGEEPMDLALEYGVAAGTIRNFR